MFFFVINAIRGERDFGGSLLRNVGIGKNKEKSMSVGEVGL